MQLSEKVRETGPCSAYDFIGTEAANREIGAQRAGKAGSTGNFWPV